MAGHGEAIADVFALGECDALYVPNYSSFSQVGNANTRTLVETDFVEDYPHPH